MSDLDKTPISVWVVTPHHSAEFDEWWGAAETESDHSAALDYAIHRLVDLWDQYDSRDPRPATVTIEQRTVEAWEFVAIEQEGLAE